MSVRRQTYQALDKEADAPGFLTRSQTCKVMDNKNSDAPGQRLMLPAIDKEADGRQRWRLTGSRHADL